MGPVFFVQAQFLVFLGSVQKNLDLPLPLQGRQQTMLGNGLRIGLHAFGLGHHFPFQRIDFVKINIILEPGPISHLNAIRLG